MFLDIGYIPAFLQCLLESKGKLSPSIPHFHHNYNLWTSPAIWGSNFLCQIMLQRLTLISHLWNTYPDGWLQGATLTAAPIYRILTILLITFLKKCYSPAQITSQWIHLYLNRGTYSLTLQAVHWSQDHKLAKYLLEQIPSQLYSSLSKSWIHKATKPYSYTIRRQLFQSILSHFNSKGNHLSFWQ